MCWHRAHPASGPVDCAGEAPRATRPYRKHAGASWGVQALNNQIKEAAPLLVFATGLVGAGITVSSTGGSSVCVSWGDAYCLIVPLTILLMRPWSF
jgi:hypothetical protein